MATNDNNQLIKVSDILNFNNQVNEIPELSQTIDFLKNSLSASQSVALEKMMNHAASVHHFNFIFNILTLEQKILILIAYQNKIQNKQYLSFQEFLGRHENFKKRDPIFRFNIKFLFKANLLASPDVINYRNMLFYISSEGENIARHLVKNSNIQLDFLIEKLISDLKTNNTNTK